MGVSNWHNSHLFALMCTESPLSSAELVWLWQNSSFPHMDETVWREPVKIYMKRQKIIISLGSVLLLLGIYAKEIIFQKKKRWGIGR